MTHVLNADVAERATEHLQTLQCTVSGLRTAVLASVDGFAVAHTGDHSGERLAAMTSAMLALGGAIGRELQLGKSEALILEASEGKVLMLGVPTTPVPMLLMVSCDGGSLMGNVLWAVKDCGRKILGELNS